MIGVVYMLVPKGGLLCTPTMWKIRQLDEWRAGEDAAQETEAVVADGRRVAQVQIRPILS